MNDKTADRLSSLIQALLLIKDAQELDAFLADLCTPGEITAFAERWEIAKLLDAGQLSYREISVATGASTTTVARVARFLFQEDNQGYRTILDRMKT